MTGAAIADLLWDIKLLLGHNALFYSKTPLMYIDKCDIMMHMITFPRTTEMEPVLHIDIDDPSLEPGRQAVNEHLSQLGAKYFMDAADAVPTFEGMQYTFVGGGKDRSKTSAIPWGGPWGNRIGTHHIAGAEGLFLMAAEAGLRDEYGNLVPILLTGAPCLKGSFGLSPEECAMVADGNTDPVAEKHIKLLDWLRVGRMSGIVSYSQSTTFTAPLVEKAKTDFDIGTVVLGGTPHADEQQAVAMGLRFLLEALGFGKQVKADNIAVVNELFAHGSGNKDFMEGVFAQKAENMAFLKKFLLGNLYDDLLSLSANGVNSVLIVGSKDHLAGKKRVAKAYESAGLLKRVLTEMSAGNRDARTYPGFTRLTEVMHTNHALRDRAGSFAVFAAGALTTTQ